MSWLCQRSSPAEPDALRSQKGGAVSLHFAVFPAASRWVGTTQLRGECAFLGRLHFPSSPRHCQPLSRPQPLSRSLPTTCGLPPASGAGCLLQLPSLLYFSRGDGSAPARSAQRRPTHRRLPGSIPSPEQKAVNQCVSLSHRCFSLSLHLSSLPPFLSLKKLMEKIVSVKINSNKKE